MRDLRELSTASSIAYGIGITTMLMLEDGLATDLIPDAKNLTIRALPAAGHASRERSGPGPEVITMALSALRRVSATEDFYAGPRWKEIWATTRSAGRSSSRRCWKPACYSSREHSLLRLWSTASWLRTSHTVIPVVAGEGRAVAHRPRPVAAHTARRSGYWPTARCRVELRTSPAASPLDPGGKHFGHMRRGTSPRGGLPR